MPKEHRDYADSDLTGMTNDDAGMGQLFTAMEAALNGKKDRKAKKVSDLHGKLLTRVKNELGEIADACEGAREKSLLLMKEKVKVTKRSGAELGNIKGELHDRHAEIENCIKLLETLAAARDSLQKKREQIELEHRKETMEAFKKLKGDIEDILNACMKGLTKNFESTNQMKKMRAFLQQLDS
eukprot:TRINITY_DN5167_c0_g4_i1.p1 TRINITY_DN5167_c0_g4~~TRINITY_DN5167_c0_g4_i1.p1  ORF type:complete len:183 (+),score=44.60 TRINITY_DN5167_c0_g4_i1:841-1389(+)